MTNTEIIQTIKAEIERIKESYDVYLARVTKEDFLNELDNFLSFLDTLESEKPINLDGLEEEIDKITVDAPPGYEKLNNKIKSWGQNIARHFAEWGAEHVREQMLKEAVKWLVDDDYDTKTDEGRFILGSVGIGYNGYYIPYSGLLKLPKEDKK